MRSGAISQLKSAIVSNKAEVRTVRLGLFKGLKFRINLAQQSQFYLGLWERETYRFLSRARGRCSWLVDVGAGRGELCLYFAAEPQVTRIVAIEPNPIEVRELTFNVQSNGIKDGRIEVIEKLAGTSSSASVVALSELDLDRSSRGLVKIDVEGFEMEVLRGARDLLEHGNVDLLVETHSAELERDCMSFLQDAGYRCSVIKNAWWRGAIPEQRPLAHNRWLTAVRQS